MGLPHCQPFGWVLTLFTGEYGRATKGENCKPGKSDRDDRAHVGAQSSSTGGDTLGRGGQSADRGGSNLEAATGNRTDRIGDGVGALSKGDIGIVGHGVGVAGSGDLDVVGVSRDIGIGTDAVRDAFPDCPIVGQNIDCTEVGEVTCRDPGVTSVGRGVVLHEHAECRGAALLQVGGNGRQVGADRAARPR